LLLSFALAVAGVPWSWLREPMASLVKTVCTWYPTMHGLMNSRAAISGLDRPPAGGRAIWASRPVSRAGVSLVRFQGVG
jgi:hypothetical protein